MSELQRYRVREECEDPYRHAGGEWCRAADALARIAEVERQNREYRAALRRGEKRGFISGIDCRNILANVVGRAKKHKAKT